MIGARSDGTAPNMAKPPGSLRGHAATVDRSRKQRRQDTTGVGRNSSFPSIGNSAISTPCPPRPSPGRADPGGAESGRTLELPIHRNARNPSITRQFPSAAAAASVAFVDRRSIRLSYGRVPGGSGRLGTAAMLGWGILEGGGGWEALERSVGAAISAGRRVL